MSIGLARNPSVNAWFLGARHGVPPQLPSAPNLVVGAWRAVHTSDCAAGIRRLEAICYPPASKIRAIGMLLPFAVHGILSRGGLLEERRNWCLAVTPANPPLAGLDSGLRRNDGRNYPTVAKGFQVSNGLLRKSFLQFCVRPRNHMVAGRGGVLGPLWFGGLPNQSRSGKQRTTSYGTDSTV